MSLFNVIGFNKKIPFTDIGKKICICHKPKLDPNQVPFIGDPMNPYDPTQS